MGRVRNVVLINVQYIWIWKTPGGRDFGWEGESVYEPGEGMGKLVYEQPGNEVDGSCHSKEGSK